MAAITIRLAIVLVCVAGTPVRASDFDWNGIGDLHTSIKHARVNLTTPRTLAINVLRVDLRDPNIRFTTTGRAANWSENNVETTKQTTRGFITSTRAAGVPVLVAINASPWTPWPAPVPDPGHANLYGLAVANGRVVSPGDGYHTMIVGRNLTPSMATTTSATPVTDVLQAASGFSFCLRNATPQNGSGTNEPRTGYGLSQDGLFLFFMTVDGRQSGYSDGCTVYELGDFLRQFGAYTGLEMDGGGSTTMATYNTSTSSAQLLNVPSGRLFGSVAERAVGNNWGVYLASDKTWTGGAGNNNWDAPANWDSGSVPLVADRLRFTGTNRLTPYNTLPEDTTFRGITFYPGCGAFTLSGNRIYLGGNIVNEDNDSQNLALPVLLSGNCSLSALGGDITASGGVGGTGSLVKSGTHTLTLSGTNSYIGRTVIEAGTLRLGSPLPSSGSLQMSGAGMLDLNGQNASFTTSAALGSNSGASTNTITDNAAGTGTSVVSFIDSNTSNNNQAALITDGASRKVGLKIANNAHWYGLLTNANNTYSGGTVLANSAGGTRLLIDSYSPTLSAGTLTQSQFGTGAITIGESATDKASMYFDTGTAGKTFYNGITFNTATGLDANWKGVAINVAGITLAGTQTANLADAIYETFTPAGQSATITGQITGSQGLSVGPVAFVTSVTLANAAETNDYAGDTKAGQSGVLILGANNQIPDGTGKGNVIVSRTLRLNGFSDTINGLTGNGTLQNNSASTASTLTLGAGDATASFTGNIANGAAATLGITKIGTGTQTISGTHTYTGKTAISDGTLKLGSALTTSGALQMTGSGTLDINGQNATFTSTSNPGSTTSSGSLITDNAAGSGTSTLRFVDGGTNGTSDGAITDGATRKVAVEISNVQSYIQRLKSSDSTYSGGTLIANNASGSRLQISVYNPTIVDGTLTKSEFGTAALMIGQSATDKASIYFDTGSANKTFYNAITFNTSTGLDANWKGVAFNVAGVTLAGTQTANLVDATYETFTGAGQTASITGQITGSQGLSVGPVAYVINLTLANAAGTNNYAGDTKIGQSGIVTLGANNQIPDGTGSGNVNVLRTLRLNGFSDTINGLTGNGTVHNNSATTASTLTLGAGNTTATFSGTLANGAAAPLHLVKTGAGTQTLSGPISHTGNTTVTQGTLALAQAVLANAATVSVSGTLRLDHASADTIGGFVLNGSQMWKGSWGPVGSAARYQTPALTGTGTLLVTAGPDPGFNGWAWESGLATLPPEQSGPLGDPDSDGNNNLLEWALGLEPLIPDRPTLSISRQHGNLEFLYHRSTAAAAAGVGYTVEWSETLDAGSWRTDKVTTEILTDVDQTQTVKATITTGGGTTFVRLRVTAP